MNNPPPPAVLRDVELIGEALALRLVELHGGRRVFVPRRAAAGQKLAVELSPEAEAALVEEFGGGNIEVPLCKDWRARIYRARGMTHAAIAERLGCGEWAVRSYLRLPDSVRQMDLPL
jgi:hypothetical protein